MPEIRGKLTAGAARFGIVASRFNDAVVDRLIAGALSALEQCGADPAAVEVVRVPGAFEIPVAAKRLIQSRKLDAVIALGCVIRGETPHFDYIADQAANGLGRVGLELGVPVAFGVLTVDSVEQAFARAGLKSGNKGAEAALAAVEMVDLFRRL